MRVIVSKAPQIITKIQFKLNMLSGNWSSIRRSFDSEIEKGIEAWIDNDAFFDSDGDGLTDNDRDEFDCHLFSSGISMFFLTRIVRLCKVVTEIQEMTGWYQTKVG